MASVVAGSEPLNMPPVVPDEAAAAVATPPLQPVVPLTNATAVCSTCVSSTAQVVPPSVVYELPLRALVGVMGM